MPQPIGHAHGLPSAQTSTWDFTPLLKEQPNSGFIISDRDVDDDESIGSDIVVATASQKPTLTPTPTPRSRAVDIDKRALEVKHRRRALMDVSVDETIAVAGKKRSAVETDGDMEVIGDKEVKRAKLEATLVGDKQLHDGTRPKHIQQITTTPRSEPKFEQLDCKPTDLIVIDDDDDDDDDEKISTPARRRPSPTTPTAPARREVKPEMDYKSPVAASGPFIIDNGSSDDEADSIAAPKKPPISKQHSAPSKQPTTPKPVLATSPGDAGAQKAAQRLASERMRQEAAERRMGSNSSRTSSVVPVASAVRVGSQRSAATLTSGAVKQQQRPRAAQGAKDETRRGKGEDVVVLDSPASSRSSKGVGQQRVERAVPKASTEQVRVAGKGGDQVAVNSDARPRKATTRAEPVVKQTLAQISPIDQAERTQRERPRREREMVEAEKEAQAIREVDARIEAEAREREAEAEKREAEAAKQEAEVRRLGILRQQIQAQRNAEAKRRQALDDESEAKRKQLLNDEVDAKRKQILRDEVEAKKRAKEEERQALREVDARIEAEARERAAEEKKADDLRRQTQAQKEVLRQHVQAKKDVEAKWAQRMLDQAEAKKKAREKELRGWREAEEAKKAGGEARRKQQEVRDAVAKRFAGSGSTPTIPVNGGEGSSVPQSRPATRDDELAKVPKAYAEPAGRTAVERTDAKVLPATNAHATTTAGREAAVASAVSTDADESKQDRVRALKDRNARYQLDAEARDRPELTDANERRKEPTRRGQTGGPTGGRYKNTRHELARSKEDGFAPLPVKPRPSGPMSLNGFVEQAALHRPNGSNDGRLHKITATDVTMIKLKHSGLPWNDVCIALRKATGIQESDTALAKRWTLLKSMLTSSDGPEPLLEHEKRTEGVTLEQLKDWMQSSAQTNDGYCAALGEITAHDVKLLQWQADGLSFQDIVPVYQRASGIKRPHEALNKRYNMVTGAIEGLGVDVHLLDQVASGDPAARIRLNNLVSGKTGTTLEPSVSRRLGQTSTKTRPLKTLGEITQSDITMVRRRDGGTTFSALLPAYHQLTGSTLSETSLRRRYAAVKVAIEQHGLDESLLDRVAGGDVEAKERLNRLVHGTWPVRQSKATPLRARGGTKSGPTGRDLASRSSIGSAARNGGFGSSFDGSSSLWTRERSSSPSVYNPITTKTKFHADETPGNRSTTAGKTMNDAAFRHYLSALTELHAGNSDSEEESEEEVTDDDLCHFTYSVQRREVSKEELDEGVELDELQLVDCGHTFTNLHKANAEANRQSAISNNPDTLAALIDGGSLVRDRDDNGLVLATHSTKDAGMVEVRVERRLRTFKRGVRPNIDGGLVSRVVYSVRERTVRLESQDGDVDEDLFGEEPRHTLLADVQVEEATYSMLELANDFAIKHFVKKAFRSSSRNLDQRSLEEAQMREQLMQALDEDGEDGMFKRTVEIERGGEKTEVEVSVTKGPFRGARNML